MRDESSIWSVEVGNRHSWSVFAKIAKIAKIGSGKWEPTQTDTVRAHPSLDLAPGSHQERSLPTS